MRVVNRKLQRSWYRELIRAAVATDHNLTGRQSTLSQSNHPSLLLFCCTVWGQGVIPIVTPHGLDSSTTCLVEEG